MATTRKKKKSTGKKRRMSPAQKAALAKGRRVLAAKRKKKTGTTRKRKTVARKTVTRKRVTRKRVTRKRSPASESIVIINQGEKKMAKRRKTRRVKAVSTKRRRRRSGTYMSGGLGRGTVRKVQHMLTETAVATASAIGGTMLLSKLPIANPKAKAAMPLLAGIGLALFAKGRSARIMLQASNGLLIAGGLAITKQFAPQFALAGEDELYSQAALQNSSGMGFSTDYLGAPSPEEQFAEGY